MKGPEWLAAHRTFTTVEGHRVLAPDDIVRLSQAIKDEGGGELKLATASKLHEYIDAYLKRKKLALSDPELRAVRGYLAAALWLDRRTRVPVNENGDWLWQDE